MAKDRLEDIEVYLHHSTEKALLVSADGDEDQAVWIPKSRCEIDKDRVGKINLTAFQSLLEEKGLV